MIRLAGLYILTSNGPREYWLLVTGVTNELIHAGPPQYWPGTVRIRKL